ncbi:hypothetical protein HYPSUDRAFT_758754 [Hypholoma sublateritium FD-334 SS-4]|uniref:Uncharacterized protein n=1 Tax=Hypholoma sublateritium (strain FD-334 SS-4) TaxID=945553 RepID=A0A0D2NX52_HYPSF|nr:hypothetical protein HYPSUDRAFT_758754 [Hypholoma sublateritium FD-334 SS-4]
MFEWRHGLQMETSSLSVSVQYYGRRLSCQASASSSRLTLKGMIMTVSTYASLCLAGMSLAGPQGVHHLVSFIHHIPRCAHHPLRTCLP